jgi:hypothetical protein
MTIVKYNCMKNVRMKKKEKRMYCNEKENGLSLVYKVYILLVYFIKLAKYNFFFFEEFFSLIDI